MFGNMMVTELPGAAVARGHGNLVGIGLYKAFNFNSFQAPVLEPVVPRALVMVGSGPE